MDTTTLRSLVDAADALGAACETGTSEVADIVVDAQDHVYRAMRAIIDAAAAEDAE